MIAIVDSNGPANVGDLLCDSSPVGILTQDESAEGKGAAAVAGEIRQRAGATTDRRLMAFYRRVLAEFGDWA